LIWIAGGAMVGYCAIGSVKIDAMPASIKMMAITHAKIGRSIKNFAMKQAPCYYAPDAAEAACADFAPLAAGAASAVASEAGVPGRCAGTVLTSMPGRTLSVPCTITRSPAFRPLSTTQFEPYVAEVTSWRSATLLSEPTT